jgi:predicted dehydrogenase
MTPKTPTTEDNHPARLGIIGLGGIAQVVHLPILKQMPDVEIRAVCDLDTKKAGAIAERFQVPRFHRDVANLLERDDLDAVLVLTPTHAHMALAVAALKAGKHVLVEKPIARNAKEARRMVSAAKTANRYLMVAMNHRFRPDALALKKLIESGELGEIYKVRAGWLKKRGKWARPQWLKNPENSGGGVLMDLGIQMLDLCLWLLSNYEVQRISSMAHRLMISSKVEDTITGYLTLKDNVALSLDVSWAIPSIHTEAFTHFYGTEGMASLNPLRVMRITSNDAYEVATRQSLTPSQLYQMSFENELEHFIHCIRNNTPPQSSGEDALKIMEIIETFYRSVDEGREIIAASS